jgi:hypothetical protein
MLDDLTPLLLRLHAAVTWFLVGLIWFVQVVHYPLMRSVGSGHFREYERLHRSRTNFVVAPAMLLELLLAIALVVLAHRSGDGVILGWVGIVLLAIIWASTFGLQVPLHRELGRGFDGKAWQRLVISNLLRTLAWSSRGVIALLLLR